MSRMKRVWGKCPNCGQRYKTLTRFFRISGGIAALICFSVGLHACCSDVPTPPSPAESSGGPWFYAGFFAMMIAVSAHGVLYDYPEITLIDVRAKKIFKMIVPPYTPMKFPVYSPYSLRNNAYLAYRCCSNFHPKVKPRIFAYWPVAYRSPSVGEKVGKWKYPTLGCPFCEGLCLEIPTIPEIDQDEIPIVGELDQDEIPIVE